MNNTEVIGSGRDNGKKAAAAQDKMEEEDNGCETCHALVCSEESSSENDS